jgi:phosphoribosylglycinamide formyltransferase-1
MSRSLPIAVLLSGGGSNLQSIIDHVQKGRLQASIRLVVSNDPRAGGLERARAHAIPTRVLNHRDYPSREQHDAAIVHHLQQAGVEVVCLAGYMRLIGKVFVQTYPQRILNIHPSLLPAFPGLDAQQQAADAGVRFSGATVHFVDEKLDHGPIIIQGAVPAYPGEGRERLARRILALEHRIYPQALQWLAADRVRFDEHGLVRLLPGEPRSALAGDQPAGLVNPPLESGF